MSKSSEKAAAAKGGSSKTGAGKTSSKKSAEKTGRRDAAATPPPAEPDDAITLLKADHRKVEALFDEFDKARRSDSKAKIVAQICTELKVHTQIEEEIFYPAVRARIDEAIVDEGYVEHDGAKVLINDLEASHPGDRFYDAKVKVLSEEIRHHVQEEERWLRGMFSQARRTDLDMAALGEQLGARKAELMAQAAKGKGLPPALLATMTIKPPKSAKAAAAAGASNP